jgi:hypothetical protein
MSRVHHILSRHVKEVPRGVNPSPGGVKLGGSADFGQMRTAQGARRQCRGTVTRRSFMWGAIYIGWHFCLAGQLALSSQKLAG